MLADPNLTKLLIRSFDEELSASDSRRLQQALAASPALRKEKEKLRRMRELVGELSVARDPDFAARMMIRLMEKGKYSMDVLIASIFPKAAAACLLIFLFSLLVIYFTSGDLTMDTIIGVQGLTPEDAGIYLSGR